jgi:Mg-chelatase subunit ChlD
VGYRPLSERFFEILRWKQVQAGDGRRQIAVGSEVRAADSWEALSERQICERIVRGGLGYKVIAGKLPAGIGLTPAIMAAAVEAGALSDQDLIILSPTLEELGLLASGAVARRWKAAVERAENQRAQSIARNVRSREARESLEEAVDRAAARAVEEVTRDLRFYIMVDISGSMEGAIEQAKVYLSRFVGAFPLDRLHVSVFNTVGREVQIKTASRAGVTQAFRGFSAGGGTSYAAGLTCLVQKHRTGPEEDALLIFIGDEDDARVDSLVDAIRRSGLDPVAFGLLHVDGRWGGGGTIVEQAAAELGLPCFKLEERIFEDVYAVPRTLRNIIAATPVKKAAAAARPRVNLVEQILCTPLLQKPAWAWARRANAVGAEE